MGRPAVSSWEVTREGRRRVEVTLRVGPRVLVGLLTRAELARVSGALDAAVEAERRGDYSRVRLGTALREAIGRDPLGSPGRDEGSFLPVWPAIANLVLGFGFAVREHSVWLRLLGGAVAAYAVVDLARRAWWHRRHRPR